MKNIGDRQIGGNPEDILQLVFMKIVDIIEMDNSGAIFDIATASIIDHPINSTSTRSRILIDNKN